MNNAICHMPFNHIFGNSSGHYYLCCHTSHRDSFTRDWNFKDDLPFDYFNSDDMNKIRDNMLKGIRVPECSVCYNKEDNGVKSDRQKYDELDYIKQRKNGRTVELKISIHGNWCNLSCVMCAPAHSSERTKEIKNNPELLNLTRWAFVGDKYKINSKRFSEIVDNIIENIDRVASLQFSTDGEPLQNPRFYMLLDKIPNDHAKEIDVSVTTNFSKDGLDADRNINSILRKFRHLGIRVSCDHFGEKYDWVRWKGDHHILEENLLKYRNVIDRISPAASVLNVADLLDAEEYYYNLLGRDLFGLSYSYVKNPVFLNPSLHKNSTDIAHKFLELEKWKSLGEQILYNRVTHKDVVLEKMHKYLNSLSKYRGNWKELWDVI